MPDGLGHSFQGTQQRGWLDYLPAIFQQQSDLGNFLAAFEKRFALFEDSLNGMERNLAVSFAPFDDFLPWLAEWVGHIFDEGWNEDKSRRFLAQAMELYRSRGTVTGLKRYIELWLDLCQEDVNILERRWPGGMQIGVSSRVGYVEQTSPSGTTSGMGMETISRDYYVVDGWDIEDTCAPVNPGVRTGKTKQVYYDARFVRHIVFETDGIRIFYLRKASEGTDALSPCEAFHLTPPEPAGSGSKRRLNVRRVNCLIDYRASVDRHADPTPGIPAPASRTAGGTLLVAEVHQPYSFIVEIRAPKPLTPERIAYLRDLLDREELALTPERIQHLRDRLNREKLVLTPERSKQLRDLLDCENLVLTPERTEQLRDLLERGNLVLMPERTEQLRGLLERERLGLPPELTLQLRDLLDCVNLLLTPDRIQQLRDLLDREKPSHTQYALRFMPGDRSRDRPRGQGMQIGVRSSVGLDTFL